MEENWDELGEQVSAVAYNDSGSLEPSANGHTYNNVNTDYEDWDLTKSNGHTYNHVNTGYNNWDLSKSKPNPGDNWSHSETAGTNGSSRQEQGNKNFKKANGTEKKNTESEKPKSTYIPPEFEEDDNLTIEAGSNFIKYDKIEVTVSGMEVKKCITSFEDSGLREILLENLKKCHYTTPTPIQKYSLPIIMDGKDMIASAQTGSGKTVSVVKSILNICII